MDNNKVLWDSHGKWHMANYTSPATTFPPVLVPGKIGMCCDFPTVASNGTGFYVADSPELRTGDVEFTVCGWIWIDTKGTIEPIITKLQTGGNYEFALIRYTTGDRFNFVVSSNGSALTLLAAGSAGAPSLSTWYFVIAWHDPNANTINIQVNNGAIDSVAYSTGVFSGTSRLGIGEYTAGFAFDGRLDGVGYWKRILSPQERAQLYNGGSGIEYPFLPA